MVLELDSFQRQVAQKFVDPCVVGGDELLSIAWVGKLLDAFPCCQEEFRAVVFNHRSQLQRSPISLIGASRLLISIIRSAMGSGRLGRWQQRPRINDRFTMRTLWILNPMGLRPLPAIPDWTAISAGESLSTAVMGGKSVDEVWREIVSGQQKEMKEEAETAEAVERRRQRTT